MEKEESNQFHGLSHFPLGSLCNRLPQIRFLVLLHIKLDFPAFFAVQGGHTTAPHQWNLRKSNSFKFKLLRSMCPSCKFSFSLGDGKATKGTSLGTLKKATRSSDADYSMSENMLLLC